MSQYTSQVIHSGEKSGLHSTKDATELATVLNAINTQLLLLDTPVVSIKNDDFTAAAADHKKIFEITAADKTATLPSTVAGLTFTFCVKTLGGSTGFSIAPAAADYIMHENITDNTAIINTAATDVIGDTVTLVGDGVGGWFVTAMQGTWDSA